MLGFHSSIPFEIMMAESKFSNNKHIQSEVGLADTGYGQGQDLSIHFIWLVFTQVFAMTEMC